MPETQTMRLIPFIRYKNRISLVCLCSITFAYLGKTLPVQRYRRFPLWTRPTPIGIHTKAVTPFWNDDNDRNYYNNNYYKNNNHNNRRHNNQQRRTEAFSATAKWPNRVVVYAVDSSLERFRPMIRRAIQEIEARTCIRFRSRQNENDYVWLTNGDGCHSRVGRSGGRQILSLGIGCHDVGSILHELCHAIGLYHEHMRYDRDQYLQIEWNNIRPSMYEQFQKVPVQQYRPASHFDYNSIMIYGSKAFTRNGRNTMTPRNRMAHIVESHYKQRLAQSDVININSLYGCLRR